jgi:hypothetical protein
MEQFPFDRQLLNVNGFSINSEFANFNPDLGIPPCVFEDHVHTCIRLKAPKDSWLAEEVSLKVSIEGSDSEMGIQMKLTRRPEFYLFNIMLINFLIVTISLSVYTIDAQDFATRVGILETNLLTAVAFKFVINSYVPSVPYLTLLDKYMILTFMIMFTTVVVSFIMSLIDADAADLWNSYFTYAAFGLWVFVHVVIVVAHMFGLLTPSWKYVESHQDESDNDAYTLVQKRLFDDSRYVSSMKRLSVEDNPMRASKTSKARQQL